MANQFQTIHLHLQAPSKPSPGASCNGCGVCCAAEPCPVGQVLSRRRRGPCVALAWDDSAARYQCGALPAQSDNWYLRLKRALLLRWIAAGVGCDSTLQPAMQTGATIEGFSTCLPSVPSHQPRHD